ASLREHWSIVLSQKKTYMVTPGRFDIAELEKRNNYRGIIRNIPTKATKSLLLRQLKKYKVQAVQILNNSNGNKARRAYIYFSSEQDKKAAQDTSVYYFDTKLFWNDNAERRREKTFYNHHQHQYEMKTIKNNKKKPILREMEQFKKIKPNNLSKQLIVGNSANY
ncbi:5845_t:CDS:1, partial [Gigaspora rosea]